MPPDIESHKLFAQLASTQRPHKLVPFPRNKPGSDEPLFDIAMVILTNHETTEVAASAERKARDMLKNYVPGKDEQAKGYSQIFDNICAIETLYRACRDPEDLNKKVFPSPKAISDVLTTDEISILLNHYFTVQVELGPIVGTMSEIEMNAWVDKLAEGGQSSLYFLNSFTWETAKELMMHMAVQLSILQMAKSSPGLPLEEPSTNEPKKRTRKSKTSDKLQENLSLMTFSDSSENLTPSDKENNNE